MTSPTPHSKHWSNAAAPRESQPAPSTGLRHPSAKDGAGKHWFTTPFSQGRCRKALVYDTRQPRTVPESTGLRHPSAKGGAGKHWFTTPASQGRCRKARLGVWSPKRFTMAT